MGKRSGSESGSNRWGIVILVLLCAFVVLCGIGAHSWKRDLRVSRITTEGNKILTDEEILTLAAIPHDARLYSVDIYAAQLRVQRNPFVRSVGVRREAPDGVVISVEERSPIAALALDRLVTIDSEGVVLPSVATRTIFDLPVLTGDLPASECIPGHRVSSRAVHQALDILVTARQVSEDLYRLISEIHLDGEKDIVMYTTEAGVPVIFGWGDVPTKLLELDGFWKQIVVPRGASDLTSVDLRFANQVVVRWNREDTGVQ
jgi:cell division protein FtsQ